MPGRDYAKVSGFISVANSDTLILSANPSRIECTFVNDGANVIYLQLQKAPTRSSDPASSTAAAANQGIRLAANGGAYTTQSFKGEVRGFALVGATNLTVVEL